MRKPQSPSVSIGVGAVCSECHRLGLRFFVVRLEGLKLQVWQHCDHCGLHVKTARGRRPGLAERLLAIGLVEELDPAPKLRWNEERVLREVQSLKDFRRHRRWARSATTPFPNTPTLKTKPFNSMDGPGPLTYLQPELENDNPAGPVSGQSSSDRQGTVGEKGLMEPLSSDGAQDQAPASRRDHLEPDPV